jgi:hypothetical protein
VRQQILTITVDDTESWTLILAEIRSVRRHGPCVHIAPIGPGRIIHAHFASDDDARQAATRIDFALASHHEGEVSRVG